MSFFNSIRERLAGKTKLGRERYQELLLEGAQKGELPVKQQTELEGLGVSLGYSNGDIAEHARIASLIVETRKQAAPLAKLRAEDEAVAAQLQAARQRFQELERNYRAEVGPLVEKRRALEGPMNAAEHARQHSAAQEAALADALLSDADRELAKQQRRDQAEQLRRQKLMEERARRDSEAAQEEALAEKRRIRNQAVERELWAAGRGKDAGEEN